MRPQLQLHRYRVRRWTAYEWSYEHLESGKSAAQAREALRKKNEQSLDAAAAKYNRKLGQIAPDFAGEVKRVGVKRKPQLMFELEVEAASKEEAMRKAEYRIRRLLSVPIAPNRNPPPARGKVRAIRSVFPDQNRCLRPPWGNCEIEMLS